MKTWRCLALLLVLAGCSVSNKLTTEVKARQRIRTLDTVSQSNIAALLEMIEKQIIVIKPEDNHYIPYEFRIPKDSRKKHKVQRIDASVYFTDRGDTYQCIGENATKEKVFQIVALAYSYKIKFCPFE